jgi:hypothetical protein
MYISNKSLISDEIISVDQFTINDIRSISFAIENDSDNILHDIFTSKISKNFTNVDIFNSLINARCKYINNKITLNNGTSNINISIDNIISKLNNNIVHIREELSINNLNIILDYPDLLYFNSSDELMISCIKLIRIKDKLINFNNITKSEKLDILNNLPVKVIDSIEKFIIKNNKDIVLFESKLGIDEITVNFFNNSSFLILKNLYHYYNYDSLIEILFMISKRITDMSFLNSRTPYELDEIIRMYGEEISEK